MCAAPPARLLRPLRPTRLARLRPLPACLHRLFSFGPRASIVHRSSRLCAFPDNSATTGAMPVVTGDVLMPVPAAKKRKLLGREFYESIGSPKTIVAPMVDQSELAWRILSRRHSPANTLCYTPMFHSRIFTESRQYRSQAYNAPKMDGNPTMDRPTFVQFCSNEPADLLGAARYIQDHCDAVDLNLGCPQGIAKKGHYGAFLQEEWDLIHNLINGLAVNLDVPVTAKIRILETKERSLEYAKMVVNAGATVVTVHGRTREQKGHNTGLADWSVIQFIRENLPRDIVMFANGNILWHEDISRCLEATGVDGVMSAEGNLCNPALFEPDPDPEHRYPRMDVMAREYLDIVREQILPHLPLQTLLNKEPTKRAKKLLNEALKDPSLIAIKAHLFKMWHTLLPRHTNIRDILARSSCRHQEDSKDPLFMFEKCLTEVEKVIKAELEAHPEPVDAQGRWIGPDTEITFGQTIEQSPFVIEVGQPPRKVRRSVPWYRCQPYIRPSPEEAAALGAHGQPNVSKGKDKSRAPEEETPVQRKKVKTSDGGIAEVTEKDYTMNEKADGPLESAPEDTS